MRHAGLFKELTPELLDAPSLAEAKEGLPVEDRARAAAYLRQASVLSASSGCDDDWFTGEKNVALRYSRTDGAWIWTDVLAHYVEKHGVALPQDLLEHMRAQDWHCPVLTQQQLIEVSEELFKELKKSKKLRRRS
ncbi:hypothetical protein FJV41_08130 [Myxococcus llanfairpwllgwyngyllgogerychwyrndrobwllllantysiliogogogochensis]|uniref:Uncharacterized protein n=2 Tax=Myxococcus llanfairpwllgwyngyllgogerychwyrndrobwllllantysiliogogogochensis TaxID=2590453 RepID=A0A540X5A5_9BACT|nr:hypothetical protein FJV41_08130 [Myxococcus llanfairpwllgwyngyllgogerychwyrndrobwllllantysiliogogogochensis]